MHVQHMRSCLSKLTIFLLYAGVAAHGCQIIPEVITFSNTGFRLQVIPCYSSLIVKKLQEKLKNPQLSVEEKSTLACLVFCLQHNVFWNKKKEV